MPDLTVQDMAARLRTDRLDRRTPAVPTTTDPIVETPMVVTLDQVKPCDLNPRVTRNPLYDEIRASIRERGLDAPPVITRRPGESQFMIYHGGNTRLSILRDLWTETRDERFFRISCLFRPWSTRGDIVALTGHLCENELRGELSFIERALAVEKARELYEQEIGKPLSQRELARRLTADGYPISHSLISRLQDAVHHLLPAIPTVLYAGLGKPQVERLGSLRRAAGRVWALRGSNAAGTLDFPTLFQDVLSTFDVSPDEFQIQRVQDELLRQMANLLAIDYDTLALEIIDAEGLGDALTRDPAGQPELNPAFTVASPTIARTAAAILANPSTPVGRPQAATRTDPTAEPAARAAPAASRSPDSDFRNPDDSHDGEYVSEDAVDSKEPPNESLDHDGPAPARNSPRSPPPRTSARDRIESSPNTSRQLRAQVLQLATDIGRETSPHLSRGAVSKLVQLVRLARQLLELESNERSSGRSS
jgi:ParB family protein of integrating conjugative element (PFGI_1 class)